MEKPISVVVADPSEGFRRLVSDIIDAEADMYVAAASETGTEAAERVGELGPDVLITDLLLREMEGLELIRRLKEQGALPHTIVVSGYLNDSLAALAGELGVERTLSKPCRVGTLLGSIRECAMSEEERASRLRRLQEHSRRIEAEKLVDETLAGLGLVPHLNGSRYLREALIEAAEDREKLVGVTKVLYPELGRRFHTDGGNIERCIRTALDVAWREENRTGREAWLGTDGAAMAERPGNVRFMKLFMARLDRLKKEKNK